MSDTILPFNVTAGISAAGDIAFSGALAGTTGTFTKLLTASAGISASALTVSGRISSTEGITFGSGTTFMAFIPNTAQNSGGLWVRDGMIQVGGTSVGAGQGNWSVNPFTEIMYFSGRQEMYVNNGYQSGQNAISIAIGTSHTADAIRITKQTGTLSDTYKIAGCNSNGVWYGAGVSASGGTFAADIAVNGVRVGRGAGSIATNSVLGTGAGASNRSGANNIFVGSAAGDALTTGSRNIAIGSDALGTGVTTGYCIAVGYNALLLNRGDQNIAIGDNALTSCTTGLNNVALGVSALQLLTTGSYNMSVGGSLRALTTGTNNVAIGQSAAVTLDTGTNNIAIGTYAFYGAVGTSDGNTIIGYAAGGAGAAAGSIQTSNTFIGAISGYKITTGSSNVGVGYQALRESITGTRNVALGYNTLYGLSSGVDCVAVGYQAGDALTTGARNIAIGTDALGAGVTANDNVAIGHNALLLVSSGVADGTVAIGSYAADALTTGTLNTAIGYNALGKTNTGSGNVAIGYLALENATTPSNNVAIGRYALNAKTSSGDGNVAIGTNAMVYASSGSSNTAVGGSVMGGAVSTGTYNSAIGYSALYLLTSGSYNCAMGPSSLYSLTTGNQNCAVGMDCMGLMTTGSNNTAIGTGALYGVSSGGNNIAIGNVTGRYYGAAGITQTTTLNNSTYIGYAIKASADSVTNEMVFGYQALGLGSNTTAIGNSSTTATTIYGVLNAPSGISANGSTFGSISATTSYTFPNGQTASSIVTTMNGISGSVGAWCTNPGYTMNVAVFTYPNGVTAYNASKQNFYQPSTHYFTDVSGFVPTANRLYFELFHTATPRTIKTIRYTCLNTGITGSYYITVYDADPSTGFPKTRLYSSASTVVGSGYSQNTINNSGGLVTVPAGHFYIAVTFSSTPTVYANHKAYINLPYGSTDNSSGYKTSNAVADTNGFTAGPTSFPATGVTFALVDYTTVSYIGVALEYSMV